MIFSFLSVSFAVGLLLQPEKQAPSLPPPAGPVVWARDAESLRRALEGAAPGTTVLVADGAYRLNRFLHLRDRRDLVVRGASGDPSRVVLSGRGWAPRDEQDDILRISGGRNLTIAHLTFTDCHSYGIKVEAETKPENLQIYDCRFRDIGIGAIKGSTSIAGKARGGAIRYCRFENTRIPPADWRFGGDYISAIDMMSLDGWTISDNVFRNIRGRTGNARGAVFIWVRSRNVVGERNLLLGCDRGGAFGNPSGSSAFQENIPHVSDGVIRNNFMVAGSDAGIELWWVSGVRVHHNTVWREDPRGRGIRGGSDRWRIERVDVANNLVRGTVQLSGGVNLRGNVTGDLDGWFVDPRAGDLRLTAAAAGAIGRAVPLPEVKDDFGGRPRDAAPDVGASEFGAGGPDRVRKEVPR